MSYASEFLSVRKTCPAAPSINQALRFNRDDLFALNEVGILLYLSKMALCMSHICSCHHHCRRSMEPSSNQLFSYFI